MQFFQDFKEFAIKGNAIDMAVGIITGVAFTKIVTSLVSDIIMPPIGYLIGGVEFKDLEWVLRQSSIDPEGDPISKVAIRYGLFINSITEFLIIAFSAFVVMRVMNRLIRQREDGDANQDSRGSAP